MVKEYLVLNIIILLVLGFLAFNVVKAYNKVIIKSLNNIESNLSSY